ncbi:MULTISPECIES: hypothetical protein [Priestia]|uniref:hypothetical protein n=1 Tax=Priestia TaxID=2800373 RepID=UPI002877254C|nr:MULTISPECIES: hypothetical protein [Priestia]MBX4163071.1 hypothetical protein [Priestia megaterium]MED3898180.1 hypothetical protein [Priestia aryabhattai]
MSYYYKNYLKGSPDNDRRHRCNNDWHRHHCKKCCDDDCHKDLCKGHCDDDCERPDFDDRPAFGTVTGTTITGTAVNTPLTFTNLLSPSENVRVVSSGIEVLESGEYFISFLAFFTPVLATTTVSYTINAGGFTQTVPSSADRATASLVRYLRRGDTVTVTATVTTAAGTTTTINAALTVAKISSRFSEKDFY